MNISEEKRNFSQGEVEFPYPLEQFVDDGFGNRVVKEMPMREQLDGFYAANFERTSYRRKGKVLEAYHRASFALGRVEDSRRREPAILEVGSGNGQFLAACKRLRPSSRLSAIEFENPDLSELVHSLDITRYETLDAVEEARADFDLITLWHVVEHMVDPWETLGRLRKMLKTRGVLVFTTPNMFCPGLMRQPGSWPWNQSPPVHLWHFGPASLRKRLKFLFPEESVRVFTRESRDANFLFDACLRPALFDRLPGSRSLGLRLQAMVRLFVACFNECLINPFLNKRGLAGSEIVAVVRSGIGT